MKAKKGNEENEPKTALMIAYNAVMGLRYTQSKLIKMYPSVNHHTLGRINAQLPVKKVTERYYLQLFVEIIQQEYKRRMNNGGDKSRELLVVMKDILLTDLNIKWKDEGASFH